METPSMEDLSEFYKNRKNNPDLYTYSGTGDLIQKDKSGKIIKTITIPTYLTPSSSDLISKIEERDKRIASAETEYDKQRRLLYNLVESKSLMGDILQQNKLTEEAEHVIINERYPLRIPKKLYSVDIKDILFEEKYEKRKVPYRIMSMKTSPLNLQDMYVQNTPPITIPSVPNTSKPINITDNSTIDLEQLRSAITPKKRTLKVPKSASKLSQRK